MADVGLLAKSRTLAKLALASAIALVGLDLSLFLFVDHASVSEAFLILWGLFLLLAAIIAGVALSYVFMTRGLAEASAQRATSASGPPEGATGREETGTLSTVPGAAPEVALRLLSGDERSLYWKIVEAGGSILQKQLVGEGLYSGSRVTRILDRLQRKGLIERERHGMTNRIRLSEAWRENA